MLMVETGKTRMYVIIHSTTPPPILVFLLVERGTLLVDYVRGPDPNTVDCGQKLGPISDPKKASSITGNNSVGSQFYRDAANLVRNPLAHTLISYGRFFSNFFSTTSSLPSLSPSHVSRALMVQTAKATHAR
jgi:hypothetical protein